ncbi:aldehyde dehydrogenase (NAD+)/gamma-glutamyl-gamma-aminobutyraldehyde dehydrogenase [Psychromicrobium silvestre]|uniref:Aldehyde dehydrogenase (NAD+)/gamma-glutamyl-gamma-aminobutyraldehyde dehydrogenase n=1 Tax=Psychromicrobium silvestre TaxID=1645614 RepID=A0A7Y9S878_9MICC|nr:aldehyde dehydrogenase family protein [Psychromicrobium silvestre]NYE95137.1 aldehyde dehydrogenase (NAD+)/gamma-glutamyl-gamma-aminobutyraldehyde dehydrogenase [Psychromicrobium silvestre]
MTITNQKIDWHARRDAASADGRAVIDGARVASADGSSFTSVDPATARKIAEVSNCGPVDIDRAVAAARRSFATGVWSRSGAVQRKNVLLRLADLIEVHTDELALLESMDMGKLVSESSTVDVPSAAATFRWYAELADKLTDEIAATPPGSTALVTREALGVVGAIVPWNFPLDIAAWKLAPALVMGNSVVLKPATESSLTALLLGQLALEAGVPDGVLNVVPGPGASAGEALALHPDVDALAFTGSTEVAKHLLSCSARSNMKRLSLEAGGKSSNLIFSDTADLLLAAKKAAHGAYYNQGEVCSANSRILIQDEIYDDFVAAFLEAAKAYQPGDPMSAESGAGALVSARHADSVEKAIQQGASAGTVLGGGERLTIGESRAYIAPAAIADLPADHFLHREEIFGPVAVLARFKDEREAVEMANRTQYGLAASVWTADLARAHRVSSQLVAGTVSVNTVDALGLTTPFGGFRQSGFGRDLSRHAIDNYVAIKTTWIQHG